MVKLARLIHVEVQYANGGAVGSRIGAIRAKKTRRRVLRVFVSWLDWGACPNQWLQDSQLDDFFAQQGLVQPTGQDFFGVRGQLPQLVRVSVAAASAMVNSAFMEMCRVLLLAEAEPVRCRGSQCESIVPSRYSMQFENSEHGKARREHLRASWVKSITAEWISLP